MTDTQVVPFGGEQTLAPPPGDVAEDTAGSSRNKVMLLGGVLAVLAVLGVAAYFLLSGSGSEPAPAPAPPKAAPAAPGPAAEAPEAAAEEVAPAKLNPNFGDPFKPLIVEASAAGAAAAGTTPAATGATGPATGSTQPSTGGSTQGSGSTAPSTGGSGSTAGSPQQSGNAAPLPSKAYRVQVVKTSSGNSTVTVKVNDKTYTKKAGQVFASYFKVIFIGGNENAFQFGDVRFSTKGQRAVMIAN